MSAEDGRIYERYLSTSNLTGDLIGPRMASLTRDIRRHFPPNREAKIFDMACGNGTLILLARRMGYQNIEGTDISPEQVAMAARLGIGGVREGDSLRVLREAAEASFDALISWDILEHFDKATLLKVAADAHRVLRPQGRWIIHAPNGDSPFCGAMRYGDFTHELAFTRLSMIQLLRSAGFTRMTFHEDAPGIHGFASLLRWLGWKPMAALLRACTLAEMGIRDSIVSRNFLTVAYR